MASQEQMITSRCLSAATILTFRQVVGVGPRPLDMDVLLLCMKFLQYPNALLIVVFFKASLCLRHRDAWTSHEVHWLTSGRRSYCRGPPYQDVTLAFDQWLVGIEASQGASRLLRLRNKSYCSRERGCGRDSVDRF